jgi:hypothetical protein
VFPAFRAFCPARGFGFQPIDLRWGVSREAGRTNQAMRICIREPTRCLRTGIKPHFLILLSDRYGWQPLPKLIPLERFQRLEQDLRASGVPPKVLKLLAHYRLDLNAVPMTYVLQPRPQRSTGA